jgi:hypothetical protein
MRFGVVDLNLRFDAYGRQRHRTPGRHQRGSAAAAWGGVFLGAAAATTAVEAATATAAALTESEAALAADSAAAAFTCLARFSRPEASKAVN